MDEHFALRELAGQVRRLLAEGDREGAARALERLSEALTPHVWVEEHGVFAAMRQVGDFSAHVEALEHEHDGLHTALAVLDPADPAWPAQVARALDMLEEHIDKENLGLFPAAVVSLGADGWRMVAAATRAVAAEVGAPED